MLLELLRCLFFLLTFSSPFVRIKGQCGEGTHNKKRLLQICTRGRIPIEKNIIVTDEQGNVIGTTYLRRARGLIKKGRAHFVCADKICLVCPPIHLEETEMSDNTNIVTENAVTGQGGEEAKGITAEYLLYLIEKMADDTSYLKDALTEMKSLAANSAYSEMGAPAAQGIAKIVSSREETNRQILKLYEKMYDDVVGRRTDSVNENQRMIFSEAFSTISEEDDGEVKLEMFNTLFNNLNWLK